jgi:hypothetical protein
MMFAKVGRRRLQARRRLTIQVQQARNAPADKIVAFPAKRLQLAWKHFGEEISSRAGPPLRSRR